MALKEQLSAIGESADGLITQLSQQVGASRAEADTLQLQVNQLTVDRDNALALVRPYTSPVALGAMYKPIPNRPPVPFLVLTHNDEPIRDAGHDTGVISAYFLACEIEGAPACPPPVGYKPLGNSVAYENDFCSAVQPHEDWFIHNGAGVRIYAGTTRRSYHMNPGASAMSIWMGAKMLKMCQQFGWNSVFLDNVELTWTKTRTQSVNSNGVIKEYPTEAAWKQAWVNHLAVICLILHNQGITVYGNMIGDSFTGSDWNPYLDHLDGGMFEGWYPGYKESSVADTDARLRQADWAIRRGKTVFCVGQGGKDDLPRMRRSLAAYLLIVGPNAFFRYTSSGSYPEWWDYPEYLIRLGNPTAPRQLLAPGVWTRTFENGLVRLDADMMTSSIMLKNP